MAVATSTSKRVSFVLLAVAAVFVFAFYVAWNHPPGPQQLSTNAVTIRVAYLPIYSDLPLFVAIEHDEFKKRGLNVELLRFEDSPSMGNALVTGSVDAVASIATATMLVTESRDPGRLALFLADGETKENYLTSLVVLASSEIHSVQDLKGKNIGCFPGPTKTVWAPLAFAKLGLSKDMYQLTELPIGDHVAALVTKRIDAVVTYEPIGTELVHKWSAMKLVPAFIESTTIEPWIAGSWVISRHFAANNRDAANAFIQGVYAGVDELRASPSVAKQSLSRYTAIDLSIAQLTPNMRFMKAAELDDKALQAYADTLRHDGALSRDIDTSQLVFGRGN